MRFTLLPEPLAVCRLDGQATLPDWAFGGSLVSVTRTEEELSVVAPAASVPDGVRAEGPFRAIRLEGPFPLSAVGILARVSTALADARVAVLPIGTFDTDYLLVPAGRLRRAVRALEAAGLEQDVVRPRLRYGVFATPFGRLLAAVSRRGLTWAAFGDDDATLEATLRATRPDATLTRDDAGLTEVRAALIGTLGGVPCALPLDLTGTAFQQRVWGALRSIPVGQTMTYAELAARIGLPPTGARVVAQAVAANPVALALPCHRVVRGDARPTEFRWGAARKVALLLYERRGQLSLFEQEREVVGSP
ncbi:MAG TPA: methylated-DNA--[protein]-cysteine S-methyltransferase [Rhodothermales bacterium]|nr:methylated-DNA--[protein]-cysteine S-methyltransferase [Rhodothermales bacterium]